MIDPREQARQIRQQLAEIDELTRGGRKRGLTKAETEHTKRLVNAALAHLTSLEIATGLRPIGAALASEKPTEITREAVSRFLRGDARDG